jgi:membrane peptidoglycan carboxypeptidase
MGRNGKVQGADYPSRIWGAFMEAALADQPNVDWPRPPGFPRVPARIYVPGEECVAEVVSGSIPLQPGQTIPVTLPTTPTTTMPPATSTTLVVDPSTPPITDAPPPTAATTTTSPRPVLATVEAETTVPSDVFDPRAPVPSIETDRLVYLCETPPDWVDFINLTATSSP